MNYKDYWGVNRCLFKRTLVAMAVTGSFGLTVCSALADKDIIVIEP